MDLSDLLLASFAVMSAAGIQVLVGFGFALVSIPLLLYVFPGYEAVLISMILSLFTLLIQARKNWKFAHWNLIRRLVAIGLPGLLLGVMVGGNLNANYLRGIVGLTILIYVIIQWISVERKRASVSEDHLSKKYKLPRGFYLAGFVSGGLTGVVGMPGPPVTAVLVNFLSKEKFRATLVNYFMIIYVFALIIASFTFDWQYQKNFFLIVFILLIPTLLGYLIGYLLRKFINEANFKRLVFSLLIIVGIGLISEMWTFLRIFTSIIASQF